MSSKERTNSKKNLVSLLFYVLLIILFWLNLSFYTLAQDRQNTEKTIYTPEMMNLKKAPPMKQEPIKTPPPKKKILKKKKTSSQVSSYINVDPPLSKIKSTRPNDLLQRISTLEAAIKELQKRVSLQDFNLTYQTSLPYNRLNVLGRIFSNYMLDPNEAKAILIKECMKDWRKKACQNGHFETVYPGRLPESLKQNDYDKKPNSSFMFETPKRRAKTIYYA